MVDRQARADLARAVRRLVAGLVTNDQYEDDLPRHVWQSGDPAVKAIQSATWLLYDDLHEHRLEGPDAIGREGRKHVARWILFLASDREYEWWQPSLALELALIVPNLLTFGLLGRCLRSGEPPEWPFRDARDVAAAVAAWPRVTRSAPAERR